jgi:hypothetical protein
MGIKFLCPNGHRLNVKAFLAGKKAVCPKCGEKVLVPTESDPNASKPKRGVATAEALPDQGESEVAKAAPASAEILTVQPSMAPATMPPVVAHPLAADPIAEAPSAVWYVRPPSGGQYGPAPADVMQGWIAEGRVTGNSLVWRSDWPDWRSASATFPQLGGSQMPAAMPQVAAAPTGMFVNPTPYVAPVHPMSVPMAPVVVPQSPMSGPYAPVGVPMGHAVEFPTYGEATSSSYDDPVARTKRRRQKGADATMIVSGILVALVVILFVVLAIVLSQNTEETTTPHRRKHKPNAAATAVEPERESEPEGPKVEPLEAEPAD